MGTAWLSLGSNQDAEANLAAAADALRLIMERHFHRGRDLIRDLDDLQREMGPGGS